MFVDRIRLDETPAGYAADLGVVDALRREPLELSARVTVITGPNGSGKSTLVESIAVAMGANPAGGSRNARFNAFGDDVHALPITISRSENPRDVFFLRGESFLDLAQYHATLPGDPLGHTTERSHGEGIMEFLRRRVSTHTLLLLDEPEDGLSVFTQLELLGLLTVFARRGTQIIMATHSPVLLAIPGAQLITHELEPVLYDATEPVRATREFIDDPRGTAAYLAEP